MSLDATEVLAAFDKQIRRNPPRGPGSRVERPGPVVRVCSPGEGWNGVVWSDPDLTDVEVDDLIAAQVARFDQPWEWKHYSYDRPATLPAGLVAAGLVADPGESLMVAEIADLALDVPPPAGIDLVRVHDQAGVDQLVRVHDAVFGGDHAALGRELVAGLSEEPPGVEAVLALVDGVAVSAGRVEFAAGTDFASLWGGGTLPAWRSRGVFRSLVAHRAGLAAARGFRYLQVDAMPASRPILARLGFIELATTTPYQHPGRLP